MNLPNKLTLSRAIATPIFMVLLISSAVPYNYTAALVVFILASITDLLDGKIARSYNLITNFGKFLDPVADKMLTTAALLGLMIEMPTKSLAIQMTIITFITLFREFTVSSVRILAMLSEKRRVIAANMWGKLKTVAQMVGIIIAILVYSVKEFFPDCGIWFDIILITGVVICWISALFTVISGLIYLFGNKELIDFSK
ncbi:MAG: CDP-diacylglycerol--glycerol-3-phosphate 3-phosphatidyltransferase [Clostridia bacterium]|nr:CDP-diacylglycerol--glycerol-3-phosphate 3-phosphatidyltransferase [Clostridia bacterium]